MIEFLAGALEWVKGYGEGIGSLVTAAALVVGGFWAIYEYNTAKKYESAKWLHDVFHSFYLDPRFDKLRICLEFDYTNKLAPLIERVLIDENAEVTETDKLLLCDLDTTLNYLEFILHLEKTKHLSESDRKAIFAFWYELICRPDYAALRMYVRQCGYEAISSAIVMLSGTGKSRANCIAFYGTLVGGHGTQEDLGVKEKLRHLGSCIINGELRDLGEFPGLVTGDQMIRGELYEVADLAALMAFDVGVVAGEPTLRLA